MDFDVTYPGNGAFLMAQLVKNLPAMWETQIWSLGLEDPLEKGMATHSSILARKVSWTEEPGGLQSMKSQRVRHDWATKHTKALHTPSPSYHTQFVCWTLWPETGLSDEATDLIKDVSLTAGVGMIPHSAADSNKHLQSPESLQHMNAISRTPARRNHQRWAEIFV